jgi:Animal haem peroxidase
MERMSHGFNEPDPESEPNQPNHNIVLNAAAAVFAPRPQPKTAPFTLMFPTVSDDERLTPSEKTLEDLALLGASMEDTKDDTAFNSGIPAAYTYFAQFINHDIAFTDVTNKVRGQTDPELLAEKNLSPWSKKTIADRVHNKRIGPLQLESVYGNLSSGEPPPRDGEKFALGKVCPDSNNELPPDLDVNNDLVRTHLSRNPKKDRAALINDPRNDSNLIVSQVHVAFLRAHNAIVDKLGCTFDVAKEVLQKHYQWMVYNEILPRFVREEEIRAAFKEPLFDPPIGVPLEFSVAAFRFGHTMVRKIYYLNDRFRFLQLDQMFMLTVLSNGLTATPGEGNPNLPCNKIIEWEKFLGGEKGRNNARKVRTQMVEPLFLLLNEANIPVRGEKRLAVQDLKRGYMLSLPTGQALATRIGVDKLTPDDLRAVAAGNPQQLKVLEKSEFLEQTPLWFYILAEAAKQSAEAEAKIAEFEGQDTEAAKQIVEAATKNIDKLGPVGGRIVAEAITGFIRQTPDSFLNKDWTPDKDFGFRPGTFFIPDLLRLAGVLEP